MRTDSNRDGVQTRSHNVWNNLTLRQNDGEGPWPKTIGKFLDQLSAFATDFSRAVEPLAIWQMNNERIEAGPVFRLKNFGDRDRIERISRETVNCFGRKRYKLAVFQQFNCMCDGSFGPRWSTRAAVIDRRYRFRFHGNLAASTESVCFLRKT